MPTAPRPTRPLLALALVANLLAASVPMTASGGQRALDAGDAGSVAFALPFAFDAPADAVDRAAAAAASRATSAAASSPPIRARILASPKDWTGRPRADIPAPKPNRVAKTTAATTSGRPLRGRNHVWIPALGIDRSVAGYACSSSSYPGDRVYRWGCAGGNNVYLFGHAHSVFKPLHDAYVRGRLRKGMQVHYAGSDGRVSTYAVRWWRLTTPEDGSWAYAAQSTPSLTLQTCVGSRSQYRLIVRLARV